MRSLPIVTIVTTSIPIWLDPWWSAVPISCESLGGLTGPGQHAASARFRSRPTHESATDSQMILSVILIHLLPRIRSNSSQSPGLRSFLREHIPRRTHKREQHAAAGSSSGRLVQYLSRTATRVVRLDAPNAEAARPGRRYGWLKFHVERR